MKILRALTDKAQQWIDENVICEEWQKVAGGIAGDWRMIDDIVETMLDEGFRITKKWWQFWTRIDFQVD